MIRTLNELRAWAKSKGHKIERWKTDDKHCYRIRLWKGSLREIVSAPYFYWVLIRNANAMEFRDEQS